MIGDLIGVFGSNPDVKASFLASIGKKSEAEGIVVYQRNEAGRRYSFLDDPTYPDKIQGYARLASIVDYAYFMFPTDGKLSPSDGELAILLDSFGLEGSIQLIDGSQQALSDILKSAFKGLTLSSFRVEERSSNSSVLNMSAVQPKSDYPEGKTLVYIDRAFSVKGVGVVVLGFVLSGKIAVHDRLRILPSDTPKFAEVKGIQISDEDHDSTDRGIRVGLALKGVELKDLSKTSWLDDGSLELTDSVEFSFRQSQYYKLPSVDRDLHIEMNGELLVGKVLPGKTTESRIAKLTSQVPVWDGAHICVIDLNSKPLRVVGGGRRV